MTQEQVRAFMFRTLTAAACANTVHHGILHCIAASCTAVSCKDAVADAWHQLFSVDRSPSRRLQEPQREFGTCRDPGLSSVMITKRYDNTPCFCAGGGGSEGRQLPRLHFSLPSGVRHVTRVQNCMPRRLQRSSWQEQMIVRVHTSNFPADAPPCNHTIHVPMLSGAGYNTLRVFVQPSGRCSTVN